MVYCRRSIRMSRFFLFRARCLLFAATLLGSCAAECFSQVDDGTHTIEWTTQELPNGRIQFDVRNTSPFPITAVIVEGVRTPLISPGKRSHPMHSIRGFDSATEPYSHRPIESGQAYQFKLFGPSPDPSTLRERTVTVRAVLFADGGAWGDQGWIETLHAVRKRAYQFENEALQAMVDAKAHASTAEPIGQKLDEVQKENMKQSHSFQERRIVDDLFEEIKFNIATSSSDQAEASLRQPEISPRLNPIVTPMDSAIQIATTHIHALEAAGFKPAL